MQLQRRRHRGGHRTHHSYPAAPQVLETCLEEPGAEGSKADEHTNAQVEWMFQEFKTRPCCQEGCIGNRRSCIFFHCSQDRRRPAYAKIGNATPLYVAEPCSEQFDDDRYCFRGDACPKAHSIAELLYHPDLFRKRLCHQSAKCPRGRFCAFAHSRNELLVPQFGEATESQPSLEFILYEFKTQWCPIGGPHDWESCVYAHTYRDWRRTPRLGYSSRPCQNWSQSVSSGAAKLAYADRCPRGFACSFAHGAKEQLYHPHFYKTNPCSDRRCHRRSLCAFTHHNFDVRSEVRPDFKSKQIPDSLKHADALLSVYQPSHGSPPKYHTFDDPAPAPNHHSGSSKAARRMAAHAAATAAMATQAQAQAQAHLPSWLQDQTASPYTFSGMAAAALYSSVNDSSYWYSSDWQMDIPLTLPTYISSSASRYNRVSKERAEEILGLSLAALPDVGWDATQNSDARTFQSTTTELMEAVAQQNKLQEEWNWGGWHSTVIAVPIYAPKANGVSSGQSTPISKGRSACPEEWQYGMGSSIAQCASPMRVVPMLPTPPLAAKQSSKDLGDLLRKQGVGQGMRTPSTIHGSPPESGTTTNVPSPRHGEEAGSASQTASSDPGDADLAVHDAWVPEPVFTI